MISSPRASFVTGIIVQISHQSRSEATGTAAESFHNVCPHLRILREQMLLCCQLSFEVCGTHGEEDGKTNVLGQLVSSALMVSLFKTFKAENDFLARFEVFSPSL